MYPLYVSIKHEICMQLIYERIRSTQHRSCVNSYMTFPTTIMSCATKVQQMKTLKQLTRNAATWNAGLLRVFPQRPLLLLCMLSCRSTCLTYSFSHLWSLFFGLHNSTALNLFYTTLPSRFLAFYPNLPPILGKILFY